MSTNAGTARQRRCAVTGASGYVGSRIAAQLAAAGWEVLALSRSTASRKHTSEAGHSTYEHSYFELGHPLAPGALDGIDALVHAAYDFGATRWTDITQVNVEGSRRLFIAAREAKVDRVIFVSSIAAFPAARSLYGRAKLAIERAALEVSAAIIRPGLVWGPHGAAMFGALRDVVEQLPVVPLFVPAKHELSLVHEDDLTSLVERLLGGWPEGSCKLFVAASPTTVSFGELLGSLAQHLARRPLFVRVPWQAAWLGLRVLEGIGVTPPFRSDSLLSLATADTDPLSRATDCAERYGLQFRPYVPTQSSQQGSVRDGRSHYGAVGS